MVTNRTRVLNVRMLESEMEMLNALAEREGVSVSEWIRIIVRREHALASQEKPSRQRRKR